MLWFATMHPRNSFNLILKLMTIYISPVKLWTRTVVSSDSSQHAWVTLYSSVHQSGGSGEIRACGRPTTSIGSCAMKYYFISHQYSRVCGRVIGYQIRNLDAFHRFSNTQIELDGINIATGAQHHHIWSYVAGHTQEYLSNCPCASNRAASPPQSVGNNYYCDSGDTLWDDVKPLCCSVICIL